MKTASTGAWTATLRFSAAVQSVIEQLTEPSGAATARLGSGRRNVEDGYSLYGSQKATWFYKFMPLGPRESKNEHSQLQIWGWA